MPFNLTLQGSPTYNASGKFGQSLNGGNGYTTVSPITGFPFTIEQWVKANASGSIEVSGGRSSVGWFGKAANNTALAHFGDGGAGTTAGSDITLASSVNIADGAYHHLRLVVTATGGTFSVDGVQVASSAAAPNFATTNKYFGARAFFGTADSAAATFSFTGEVEELAVFNTALPTTYTPPTAAYTGTEVGLVALYHFDGNGTDSQVSGPATAVAASGPTSGTASAVSSNFTVGANGAITGTVVVTPSDGAAGGTFSPATVSISSGTPTATFTYTAATTGAKTISFANNGGLANPASITYTALAAGFDQTKVRFSPFNWLVAAGIAKSNNDGAYARFSFTGNACTLGFDMTGNVAPHAKLQYRLDNTGPWTLVDLAASIALTIPTDTAGWAQHFVELEIVQTSESVSRWSPQSTAVVLNSITLASGGALGAQPPLRAVTAIGYGDSIFNGINALSNGGDSTVRGRAQMSYMNLIFKRLGFDFGMVAFGGQGWATTGGGSVPIFPSTWDSLWAGQSRSFTDVVPDYIVICHGQNDAAKATTAAVTTVLNGMLAATPRTTKIVVLRALSGLQAANVQAGIAACADAARVVYVDTAGWFTAANSLDSVHPLGWEHNNNIARLGLEALRPIMQPIKGARSPRTISLTLTADAAGTVPRANLTGITGAIFDQASPGALTVAADNFLNGTTDANGLFTQTVYSTLGVGAQVWLDMASADKSMAFKGLAILS